MIVHKLTAIKGKDLPAEWQETLGLDAEQEYVVSIAPAGKGGADDCGNDSTNQREVALPIIELGYDEKAPVVPDGSTKDDWEKVAQTIRKDDAK